MLSGCGFAYDLGEDTYEYTVEDPAKAGYHYVGEGVDYLTPDEPEGRQPHPELGMVVQTKLGRAMNTSSYEHMLYVLKNGRYEHGYYWKQGNKTFYMSLHKWKGSKQPCRKFKLTMERRSYAASGLSCRRAGTKHWIVHDLFYGLETQSSVENEAENRPDKRSSQKSQARKKQQDRQDRQPSRRLMDRDSPRTQFGSGR